MSFLRIIDGFFYYSAQIFVYKVFMILLISIAISFHSLKSFFRWKLKADPQSDLDLDIESALYYDFEKAQNAWYKIYVYKDPDWEQNDIIKSYKYLVKKIKFNEVPKNPEYIMKKHKTRVVFYHNVIVQRQIMLLEGLWLDISNQINHLSERITTAVLILENFPLPVKSMFEEEELFIKKMPSNQQEVDAFNIDNHLSQSYRDRIKEEISLLTSDEARYARVTFREEKLFLINFGLIEEENILKNRPSPTIPEPFEVLFFVSQANESSCYLLGKSWHH